MGKRVGTTAEIARLAKAYMDVTLAFEEVRRGNYRKSDYTLAEDRMVTARHRLFDEVLFHKASKGRAPHAEAHQDAPGREEGD